MPDLVGNVCVTHRKNKDGSATYYLRWFTRAAPDQDKPDSHMERLFRTEPNPTRSAKAHWAHLASVAAYEKQKALQAPRSQPVVTQRLTWRDAFIEYMEHAYDHYSTPAAVDARERVIRHFLGVMAEEFPKDELACDLRQRHGALGVAIEVRGEARILEVPGRAVHLTQPAGERDAARPQRDSGPEHRDPLLLGLDPIAGAEPRATDDRVELVWLGCVGEGLLGQRGQSGLGPGVL